MDVYLYLVNSENPSKKVLINASDIFIFVYSIRWII